MLTDKCWYALDVIIEPAAHEAVQFALMEAGSQGTEIAQSTDGFERVTAYFPSTPDRENIRSELAESLRIYSLPSSSVREMELRSVENRDWLGEWKKSWQPVEVGKRFLIAPPWSEVANTDDRTVIRIEPGMAFGTGTHETTRLCLVAIEKYFEGGSFLDVGTGTGILAIAAAKLFPNAAVAAFDTDPEAIKIARENASQNDVAQIEFHTDSISEATASADMVCANLTAPAIVELLPRLLALTCGRLVLSGLLKSQLDMVTARLRDLGIDDGWELSEDGDWAAVVV